MADERNLVHAMVTIEIALWEEDDPPLTQSEVEDLAHDHSAWASWRVLNVGQKRKAPLTVRGHEARETL